VPNIRASRAEHRVIIVFETPRLVIREYMPEDAAFVLDM